MYYQKKYIVNKYLYKYNFDIYIFIFMRLKSWQNILHIVDNQLLIILVQFQLLEF